MNFVDYMEEKRPLSRTRIFSVWLAGMLCGAVLMFIFALMGLV